MPHYAHPRTPSLIVPFASADIAFERKQLHADFYSEGAAIGDINGDGRTDIVAGPFWWEGPAFENRHAYYEPKAFDINGYSDNFFAYVYDFNSDGKNDILILGFPGKEARLYLNNGNVEGPWPMHMVADVVDNESPVFADITGDGKPEIVCSTGGRFGYFAPDWEQPTAKWTFVPVTEDMKVAKFTHGLGVGDVNADGKLDLLEARRWWEQTPTGLWTQHNFAAGIGGGAQMFAYDFDANGTNDVFTSLAAHRYGVAVYLQQKESPTWKRVMLASEQPQDNDYGIVFSQPHAANLADINGDGIMDIVVGKRYWAHNGHDPDERGHRVVYWYETKRDAKGGVDFVPHLADAKSGVGVDVTVGDVNGDQLPDIVTANKAGVYVLLQKRTSTPSPEPRKLYGSGLMEQKDYAHGQSPEQAVKAMQLPTGFKADLIAAEPDLVQPIAFTFDQRGRIWVIEGNSYPKPRETGAGQDRIKILEDSDGDGTYETKKVFAEGINLASGIELGFGGVWVGAAPYLMFIPDADHDDKPDAPDTNDKRQKVPGLGFTAYALLDGFGSQDTHETLNSFIWGPDGWLYGCHGVFTHSLVGKPGAPEDQRKPINAGVWRYHPLRHEFEVYAEGTSNPWGLDYDQQGEFFVTACVIPHLYHIVQGGRYQRQAGQHFNPYTYDDIKTIADHQHYAGKPRPDVTFDKTTGAGIMNNDTNALGGGHAHCGLVIYQSSQFPTIYRGQLIFGNLHGHRLVTNYTDVHGGSYIGKHGSDFMRANDMHFIPVTQKVGPDGSLYVSDWADQQICHRGSNAVENWDRSNGRIYRISYPSGASDHSLLKPPFDLSKENDEVLAKLAAQTQSSWHSRMARRIQRERDPGFATLKEALPTAMDTPVARRKMASALQRIPVAERLESATNLLKHGEDAEDPMIPLLIWYGIEPLVGTDATAALQLAKISKMPKVTDFIYRRMAAEEVGRIGLLALAAETQDIDQLKTLFTTVLESARAGNKLSQPDTWAELRAKLATNPALPELEAYMGIPAAIASFRKKLSPSSIDVLTRIRDVETAPLLLALISKSSDKDLVRRAVQALAVLKNPQTPAALTAKFADFDPQTQQDAVNTLATTTEGAISLLKLAKDKRTSITPFLARQLSEFKNAEIDELLKQAFGDLNAPKADLEERKVKFRNILSAGALKAADKAQRKILFTAVCGQCHQLFGEGQKVGPDLTGSNRANLDYLLDNVLDPNAVIGKDYQLNIFQLKDGRVASGVVKEETPAAIRLAMPGGIEQTLTSAEVKTRTVAKVSTMPEGLFDALPPEQLVHLVAYLQSGATPASPEGQAAAAPRTVPGALEGEALKVISKTGGTTRTQAMAGFGDKWSNAAQLWWTGAKPGETLTLAVPVKEAGTYQLRAVFTKAKDYGIFSLSINGTSIPGELDGFNSPNVTLSDELDLGTHKLPAGDCQLTLTLKGAHPEAKKSYMVGLDYVRLEAK